MAKKVPRASVHEDEVSGRIFDWKLYRRLLPFGRPYVKWFAVSVVMLLFLALTTMASPLVIRWGINEVVSANSKSATAERITVLGKAALLLAGLGTATFLVRYAQLWVTNITGQRIIYDLRDRVFQHIQRRSLRFSDQNPVGKLVTRVTSDIEALAELFSSGIDVVFYDLVMIGMTLGVLFWINAELALMSLALLPFVAAWSFFFKRQAQEFFRNVRSRVTRLNSYINESVTGIRVIQMFRTEDRTNARFREWNGDLRDSHIATVRNFSLFFPGVEIFSALGAAVILVAGNHYVAGGVMEIGDMMAFWFLLNKFFEPIRQISEKYNVLQSAMASAERLFRVLDNQEEIENPKDPEPFDRVTARGAIRFEGVSFAYDGKSMVLEDVDFEVAPGEKVAIVGATGAGKSSLINVLGRFYEIQAGRVTVDGHDIKLIDKHELRRAVGIVLQEVFLFADTLRENLRLGDERLDDERLLEACRTVYAETFVQSLPGGLDFKVKERGATFSLGQKQLIAFARTLVHDPPILVLDEATSNIDTETEHLIQRALDRLMEGRTVLVIAHRLSTIKKADRIIVMHHGRIREMGTHRELLANDGIYKRLYELQYRGQDRDEERPGATRPPARLSEARKTDDPDF